MRLDWLRLVFTMVLGSLLVACHHKPMDARLRSVSMQTTHNYNLGSSTARPQEGNSFVTVELVQAAESPERYAWIYAKAKDGAGKTYDAKFANVFTGESSGTGFLGIRKMRRVDPIRAFIVFEVPAKTRLQSVDVPQTVSLSEARPAASPGVLETDAALR